MIITDLYSKILLNPPIQDSDNELYIVSGYASATFARRHIQDLASKGFKIHLIIGMPTARSDHSAYLQLHNEFAGKFDAYYLTDSTPVHSKAYAWFENGRAKIGYAGSANYSQFGFHDDKQINQMTIEDPVEIRDFFEDLKRHSIYIPAATIRLRDTLRIPEISGSVPPGQIQWIEMDKSVRISLLEAGGEVPTRSGLNWGQRDGRDKNQAYLSIKQDARKVGFLPERGFTFTLVTDDGVTMDCVVAQDGRKAVHTTKDNSELGSYFRRRMGLSAGALVKVQDLERYGRTDFTLVKIDDENFQLDFSVSQTPIPPAEDGREV